MFYKKADKQFVLKEASYSVKSWKQMLVKAGEDKYPVYALDVYQ